MAKGAKGARRKSRGRRASRHGGIPDAREILEFLAKNPDQHGRRQLGRAFGITGKDRFAFKDLLREMANDGLLQKSGGDGATPDQNHSPNRLPPVGMADIVFLDDDGDLWAVARRRDGGDPSGQDGLRMRVRGLKSGPAPERLGVGDRILARFVDVARSVDDGSEGDESPDGPHFEARVIKHLAKQPPARLGVIAGGAGKNLKISPVSKKGRDEHPLRQADAGGAGPGDLVTYTLERASRGHDRPAIVVKSHGPANAPSCVSLIAIHEEGLPVTFSAEALREANAATLPGLDGRIDLRDLALITIDPADARDHDDAVHAQADEDPANRDGWIVTVAIADVAAFVTPGSALDLDARARGNSVYFPDQVVPMLPETLSAGLCSLMENQDRPVLALRMVFDREGKNRRHEFFRAIMRSAASLSYEMVQAAWNGEPDDKTRPLLDPVLKPLFAAYQALAMARDAREPLDLNIPERRIRLDETGTPIGIDTVERLEAHRLIEEFMIQANVAAAQSLDQQKISHLRRVHEAPAAEKVDALADYLRSLDLDFAKGQVMAPLHFNRLLRDAATGPNAAAVHDAVLRAQSQAVYAPKDLGHFGLNLRRYAHFTSPIRRYADIIVHRALVTAFALGPGGLEGETFATLEALGAEISDTERRAMRAERDTVDRLIAHFLSNRIGGEFEGRVTGLARTGLFVGLTETGADGFVPAGTLGDDYFAVDEAMRAMIGEVTGKGYRVGDAVTVRLTGTDPLRGQIALEMLTQPRALRKPGQSRTPPRAGHRGSGARSGGKRPGGKGSRSKGSRSKRRTPSRSP